ncbi:MAG: hypothetical protein H0T71_10805 [Acidobacteria bacterium]|nr:hypothetical protein [Acidobacteriota bacterium]
MTSVMDGINWSGAPGWQRPGVDAVEALFESLDLTGPFWRLRPSIRTATRLVARGWYGGRGEPYRNPA